MSRCKWKTSLSSVCLFVLSILVYFFSSFSSERFLKINLGNLLQSARLAQFQSSYVSWKVYVEVSCPVFAFFSSILDGWSSSLKENWSHPMSPKLSYIKAHNPFWYFRCWRACDGLRSSCQWSLGLASAWRDVGPLSLCTGLNVVVGLLISNVIS